MAGYNNLRLVARKRYKGSFEGFLSYCGLCGSPLFWPSKMARYDLYCKLDRFRSVVRTPNGLLTAFRGTVDHIKRLSDGGSNNLSNLAGLCIPCHEFKDNVVGEQRYCGVCDEPLESTDFRRVHTECLRTPERLTAKLGDFVQIKHYGSLSKEEPDVESPNGNQSGIGD